MALTQLVPNQVRYDDLPLAERQRLGSLNFVDKQLHEAARAMHQLDADVWGSWGSPGGDLGYPLSARNSRL